MKKAFLLLFVMIFMCSCDMTDILENSVESNEEISNFVSSLPNESLNVNDNFNESATNSDEPAMSEKLPNESVSPTPETKGSKSVVVLGDSIARGYGLENVENQRFSSLLEERLKTVYTDVDIVNYGVDGQTGSELLSALQTSPPAELNDCDAVIISIGGNNILQAITSLSSVMDNVGKIDASVFKDYFLYLFAKDEQKKEKYSYSCKVIDGIFKEVNKAFESDEFQNLIDKAEKDLTNEIPQIVSEIRKHNPNAEIYIQTVYNPYLNVKVSLEGVEEVLDLSSYGELAVSKLNSPIRSLAMDNDYIVAPVWERFNCSKKPLTNAGFDISNTRFSIDPHPNSGGHIVIADIYFKMLTEAQND
ncbi:MAG: hypothetical protein J6Q89_03425 [Clostridia bacterium]|nr:hypothetical protein [Clostridia bacterium]